MFIIVVIEFSLFANWSCLPFRVVVVNLCCMRMYFVQYGVDLCSINAAFFQHERHSSFLAYCIVLCLHRQFVDWDVSPDNSCPSTSYIPIAATMAEVSAYIVYTIMRMDAL